MIRESAIVRECLTALAHAKIQILDAKLWNKRYPPTVFWGDMDMRGVAWRNNTGAVRYGARQERFVRFGLPGQPDISGMFRGGQFFGLEVKADAGRVSEYQTWYHRLFGELGMQIAVVRSYADTVAALKQWGIN